VTLRFFVGMLAAEALHAIQLWLNRAPAPAPPPASSPAPIPDDVRAGYEVAVELMVSEAEMLWSKFNALLVINTILLGTSSLNIFGPNQASPLGRLVSGAVAPFVGVILCVLWWLLMDRSFSRFDYWIHSARELEERMAGPITTLTRGAEFAQGCEVTFKLADGNRRLRMTWSGRVSTVRAAQRAAVVLFAAVYVVVAAASYFYR
jgi:hypothetical protein